MVLIYCTAIFPGASVSNSTQVRPWSAEMVSKKAGRPARTLQQVRAPSCRSRPLSLETLRLQVNDGLRVCAPHLHPKKSNADAVLQGLVQIGMNSSLGVTISHAFDSFCCDFLTEHGLGNHFGLPSVSCFWSFIHVCLLGRCFNSKQARI